jgi:NADH:ubiquinone oxidoreductase subunit F (NADH-binding)
MKKYRRLTLIGMLMFCLFDAHAQVNNPGTFLNSSMQGVTSTNFYYARPNDLTIIVDMVGFVQRPGRYEIASSIDLVNLISLAGGPTPDGDMSSVNIVRLFGRSDSTKREEFHIDLENLTKLGKNDLKLEPGDLVVVDRTSWSSFRDNFGVVASVTALALSILQGYIYLSR